MHKTYIGARRLFALRVGDFLTPDDPAGLCIFTQSQPFRHRRLFLTFATFETASGPNFLPEGTPPIHHRFRKGTRFLCFFRQCVKEILNLFMLS